MSVFYIGSENWLNTDKTHGVYLKIRLDNTHAFLISTESLQWLLSASTAPTCCYFESKMHSLIGEACLCGEEDKPTWD